MYGLLPFLCEHPAPDSAGRRFMIFGTYADRRRIPPGVNRFYSVRLHPWTDPIEQPKACVWLLPDAADVRAVFGTCSSVLRVLFESASGLVRPLFESGSTPLRPRFGAARCAMHCVPKTFEPIPEERPRRSRSRAGQIPKPARSGTVLKRICYIR